MTKKIIAIWAEDDNGVIGLEGRLPWRLPKELHHFKETTMGQALLMGRVTFDGMNQRVLPGRKTLILTRDRSLSHDQVTFVHSVEEALTWYEAQDKSLFIIGGSEIFQAFDGHYDAFIRTKVHGQFDGDTYFPKIDLTDCQKVSEAFFEKDAKNAYDFTVQVWEKKG